MAYAGTADLARVLRLRDASGAQGTAMVRVLDAAASEIDFECFGGTVDGGTPIPAGTFGTAPPALVVEVNLERAVEHWQQQEAAFGILGLGGDAIPVTTARDSWGRHAHKLAPYKSSWGMA